MIDKATNVKFGLSPTTLFGLGLSIVMLSLTVSIQPVWDTFILPWRIEFLTAVWLLCFSFIPLTRLGERITVIENSEWWLIIVPLAALILWSALSISWSNSPKSAAHHTLVWAMYLVLYLFVRMALQQRGSYSKLLSALSLPLLFFSSLAILGYFTILLVGKGSALGIIYSKWGEQVNTLLPLLLIATLQARGKRFYLYAAGVSLLWLMVYVSASRTAIGLFVIGLAVVVLGVFVFERFSRFRFNAGVLASFILGVTLLLNIVPGLLSDSASPTLSRFNDAAHLGGSNDFRRLMITLGFEMIADRPLTGVGGDNFGFEVNRYRAKYAYRNPDDPTLSQAENSIPERTHNEYLQIASELGVVGAGIFAWFLVGVASTCAYAIKRFKSISPHALAASLGLVLFLVSSLVTSYSFRLVQNGLVFFFVLAVLRRAVNGKADAATFDGVKFPLRRLRVIGAVSCVLMLCLSGVRVSSVAISKTGHQDPKIETARHTYERARLLDPENPEPVYYLGIRLLIEGHYDEAVPLLEESIRLGKAPSSDYSYLATAQFLAGDESAAEQTLSEAAVLYPRSVFVLARYSIMLSMNGKREESAAAAEKARSLDRVSANTWLALIEHGPTKASELAFRDPNYKPVMDLEPYDCIYAVMTERDIRFPEERMKTPFELAGVQESGK